MFGKKLKAVLGEYRQAHEPHTAIDTKSMAEAIGFFTAQYEGVPPEKMTETQKRCRRAVTTLRRCQRLIGFIEKYEPI
jgi:hypothetical protein